jgi:hypothetical protein
VISQKTPFFVTKIILEDTSFLWVIFACTTTLHLHILGLSNSITLNKKTIATTLRISVDDKLRLNKEAAMP